LAPLHRARARFGGPVSGPDATVCSAGGSWRCVRPAYLASCAGTAEVGGGSGQGSVNGYDRQTPAQAGLFLLSPGAL